MNKVRIVGAIILLLGIAGHFLMNTETHGFWIGATIGVGGALILTGKIKKVW